MATHRTLIAQITAARARYDRARTEAALQAARTVLAPQLAKIHEQVAKLDPWGSGSPLLADYATLQAALTDSYPSAKLASLKGDKAALTAAQASFDQRLAAMREWLKEASTAKGEGEEEEEEEREREHETARR
jgi:hypothetical protein